MELELHPTEYVVNFLLKNEIAYYIVQANPEILNRKPDSIEPINCRWYICISRGDLANITKFDFHYQTFKNDGFDTPEKALDALKIYLKNKGHIIVPFED